jgi:hypothetical protein
MSAFDRLSRMCGPQVPPELLALLGEYRAEVLNEAIQSLHQLWRLAPESSRADGINFAIGALMSVRDHPRADTPAPTAPDTTTVACTCMGGPTMRGGLVLHSGYCDTVVHAPWTPQREAAIRATAKEGAGSLHSTLGATVPNEDVLGAFAELDRVRGERDELKQRLSAVLDMCDREQRNAMRWQDPIPVPEWVAPVQRAALGDDPKAGESS